MATREDALREIKKVNDGKQENLGIIFLVDDFNNPTPLAINYWKFDIEKLISRIIPLIDCDVNDCKKIHES